jgi:hypothetical protein
MESRGVGPSHLQSLIRDRSIRLAAGLAIAVAIPVAILFYFQFRSISALSQTSGVVLRQLSQETADGVTKVLVDALRTVRVDVLLKIGQRQTEPLDLAFIENTFEQGLIADPFVTRFYVWSDVTTEHHREVLAFDRTSHEFIVNPPESALLVARFLARARTARDRGADAPIGVRHASGAAASRSRAILELRAPRSMLSNSRGDFVEAGGRAQTSRTGFPSLVVTVLGRESRVYPAGQSRGALR